MNALVVAAHPDDEVLGCGGTIRRLASEGHNVYIAILGEGITSRYAERANADRVLVEALQARSREVAKMLGAKETCLKDLPDNRFDTVPMLDVVKLIEELAARFEPEVVLTHHGGDLNVDHVVVHRAVLTATRPMQGQPVREVLSFEVPSSTEWAFQCLGPGFRANVFVNISETLDVKMRLCRCTSRRFAPSHIRGPLRRSKPLRAGGGAWSDARRSRRFSWCVRSGKARTFNRLAVLERKWVRWEEDLFGCALTNY